MWWVVTNPEDAALYLKLFLSIFGFIIGYFVIKKISDFFMDEDIAFLVGLLGGVIVLAICWFYFVSVLISLGVGALIVIFFGGAIVSGLGLLYSLWNIFGKK